MVSLSCELRLCTPMLFFLLVGDSTSCGIFAELPTLVAQPAGQPVVDPAVQPSLFMILLMTTKMRSGP
jgi:hypothetical protein